MFPNVTDMDKWVKENQERLFRFVRYRKVYTPYEIKEAFMDESEFEDDGYYQHGFIREAISLGTGDWLLGFQPVEMEDGETREIIEYARLSEIRLSYNPDDVHELDDGAGEDEDLE